MEQNEIDLHKALELFFSSTHGSPVSIVYMHYNGRSRTSRGPVGCSRTWIPTPAPAAIFIRHA